MIRFTEVNEFTHPVIHNTCRHMVVIPHKPRIWFSTQNRKTPSSDKQYRSRRIGHIKYFTWTKHQSQTSYLFANPAEIPPTKLLTFFSITMYSPFCKIEGSPWIVSLWSNPVHPFFPQNGPLYSISNIHYRGIHTRKRKNVKCTSTTLCATLPPPQQTAFFSSTTSLSRTLLPDSYSLWNAKS